MIGREEHLQQIAERYRRAGYQVWVEPPDTSMPPRLSWLQGDLVARRGGEWVLVLIGGSDDQVQLLADVINQTAGWRLSIERRDDVSETAIEPTMGE